MKLKLIKRNKVYGGRVFNTIVDEVEYLSGNRTIREVAEHPGGAVVLAAFPDGRIILINQHRYPLDKFIWELPAGKLEVDEQPLACAMRELEEETGYHAKEWRKLTSIYTSPGFCSEVLHIFLATELSEATDGRKLEEGEETMTMKIFPLVEALGMIEHEEIVDAKTICGIMMGARILNHQ
jgi:ADP-ribose pyrophosphatase